MTRITITINRNWRHEINISFCTEWKWKPSPVRYEDNHSYYIERCLGFLRYDILDNK